VIAVYPFGESSMQDIKFWRIVAVAACAGLFYVGHGLHHSGGDAVPSLVSAARASGVALDALASQPGTRSYAKIYTANETGTILYVWEAPFARGANPKHVATVGVPKDDWLPQVPAPQEKK
jgi:hypothetical protein